LDVGDEGSDETRALEKVNERGLALNVFWIPLGGIGGRGSFEKKRL
jgi:hypothetical protein